MITATILGSGCTKCRMLESNLKNAAIRCGIDIKLIKSRRVEDYIKFKISIFPALIINDELICSGKVPAADDLIGILIIRSR